ncbi:hypothetical protein ACVPOY_00160 [Staphylococcus aureus]
MKIDTLRQAIIYYFVALVLSALIIDSFLTNIERVILIVLTFIVVYWGIYAFDEIEREIKYEL